MSGRDAPSKTAGVGGTGWGQACATFSSALPLANPKEKPAGEGPAVPSVGIGLLQCPVGKTGGRGGQAESQTRITDTSAVTCNQP